MIFERYIIQGNATTPEKQLLNMCRIFDMIRHKYLYYIASFPTILPHGGDMDRVLCNLCTLIETAAKIDPTIKDAMVAQVMNFKRADFQITKEERAAWGKYEQDRKADEYYTTKRPDGPMAFEDDWSGIFVRGDSVMGINHDADHALAFLNTLTGETSPEDRTHEIVLDPETKIGTKDLRRVKDVQRVLSSLLDLLQGSHHHTNAQFRQNMKPFEECIKGEYFDPITIWDITKEYVGEDAVISWMDYLGLVPDPQYKWSRRK